MTAINVTAAETQNNITIDKILTAKPANYIWYTEEFHHAGKTFDGKYDQKIDIECPVFVGENCNLDKLNSIIYDNIWTYHTYIKYPDDEYDISNVMKAFTNYEVTFANDRFVSILFESCHIIYQTNNSRVETWTINFDLLNGELVGADDFFDCNDNFIAHVLDMEDYYSTGLNRRKNLFDRTIDLLPMHLSIRSDYYYSYIDYRDGGKLVIIERHGAPIDIYENHVTNLSEIMGNMV